MLFTDRQNEHGKKIKDERLAIVVARAPPVGAATAAQRDPATSTLLLHNPNNHTAGRGWLL